jgi:predicted MFS family arabinose efflux permease
MSTAIKWLIALIAVGIIAWLVWWSGWISLPQKTGDATPTQTATTTDQATQQPPQNMMGMAAANDASDAAMTQDTAAIDTQMQGLTQDSTQVDSSLNDKQIQ